MRKMLLCLVIFAAALMISGCQEVYTSPGVSQNIEEPPFHYHPVHPNYGLDRSLYVAASGYRR